MKTLLFIVAIYAGFQLAPNMFHVGGKLAEHKAEVEKMYVASK